MENPDDHEGFLDEQQDYRRKRLIALIAAAPYEGNLSALGRALGYKDGVFIRQMRDHERAITEKTVAKIDAVHPGWFADEPAEVTAVGETDWAMLDAFTNMSDDDREAMLHEAMQKAERHRKLTQEILERAAGGHAVAAKDFNPTQKVPGKAGNRYIRRRPIAKKTTVAKKTQKKA